MEKNKTNVKKQKTNMKDERKIKMLLPKGRIFEKVKKLLRDAGIDIATNGRNYRPKSSIPHLELKILKPRNIAKLIEIGKEDIGFTGYDWVYETKSDVKELIDLGFDPVEIVSAVPFGFDIRSKKDRIVVASEYPNITREFLEKENLDYVFIQTYGATEVFPPEDADMIIDNTSTGETLRQNQLKIYKKIMSSSTRFIANKEAMKDPWKRKNILEFKTMLGSILLARDKVLLEMNVSDKNFEGLVKVVPCMKAPTVQKLSEGGYAIKVAIPKKDVRKVIPIIKKYGAEDILEYSLNKIIL